MNPKLKFKIGIVMAGAVSAGAYTAGVIDYLLEALQRWEVKKQEIRAGKKTDPGIPMHDVVIEVMGGASAGGMTAAIATLSLFKGIVPVTSPNPPNCQSFLRKHFSIDNRFLEGQQSPLFKDYSNCLEGKNPVMFERFAYSEQELSYDKPYDEKPWIRYPIIPDTLVRKASAERPYFDVETGTDYKIEIPESVKNPKIHIQQLERLKGPLKKRISGIMNVYVLRIGKALMFWNKSLKDEMLPEEVAHQEAVNKIVRKYFAASAFNQIALGLLVLLMLLMPIGLLVLFLPVWVSVLVWGLGLLIGFRLGLFLIKKMIVDRLTASIFTAIVSDFKKRDLLDFS